MEFIMHDGTGATWIECNMQNRWLLEL